MSSETNSRLVLDLESRILRALCSVPTTFSSSSADHASERAAILATLRSYRWRDPEHRVVFEALTLLPGRHGTELREQLPAQATRMGFPDVNWRKYFTAAPDHSALETLVAELLATSRTPNL
jgi:hypothetical protein